MSCNLRDWVTAWATEHVKARIMFVRDKTRVVIRSNGLIFLALPEGLKPGLYSPDLRYICETYPSGDEYIRKHIESIYRSAREIIPQDDLLDMFAKNSHIVSDGVCINRIDGEILVPHNEHVGSSKTVTTRTAPLSKMMQLAKPVCIKYSPLFLNLVIECEGDKSLILPIVDQTDVERRIEMGELQPYSRYRWTT